MQKRGYDVLAFLQEIIKTHCVCVCVCARARACACNFFMFILRKNIKKIFLAERSSIFYLYIYIKNSIKYCILTLFPIVKIMDMKQKISVHCKNLLKIRKDKSNFASYDTKE